VVKAAQQRANEIAVSAQTQSREMRTKVTDYCDNLLRKTEEQFTRSTAEVKTLRASLRQPAGKNTAKVTPKPQQNNLP
ncbi:MAG: ATPase, partial [Ruthenibacterium sp.]